MSYNVRRTDNINNTPLTVEDNTLNSSTSLTFPGRNVAAYGSIIAENFLHLLENFANTTAPDNPIEGQLWYDKTDGVNQLKIYDGTGWASAGGLKKGELEPDTSVSFNGDLWVNTDTQQVFLYNGASWVLVGPRFSTGVQTGAEPETIVDAFNQTYSVVSLYVAGERVAIVARDVIRPKKAIPGFGIIKVGINLNSGYGAYWGTVERAQALQVGTATVDAANFLRGDTTSTTNFPIKIKTSQGLTLGPLDQLAVSLEGNNVVFNNKLAGNITLSIINNNAVRRIVTVDPRSRVGINNTAPNEALDLDGNFVLTGTIRTPSTEASISTTSGSIVTAGGVGIGQNLNIGGALSVGNNITLRLLPNSNLGASIVPIEDQVSDLGTNPSTIPNRRRFRNVYAQNIYADTFVGTLQGSITGNSNEANRLRNTTTFQMVGDVTSSGFSFDGAGGSKIFDTTLDASFLNDKPSITVHPTTPRLEDVDKFLISRNSELYHVTKQQIWSQISRTPVGVINTYAGETAPTGWLLCDGSEVLISSYPELFAVIRYIYGDPNILQGQVGATFKLPDMRGRFPLGLDNMTSGLQVPSAVNGSVLIETGGGSANRVTSSNADDIGLSDGSETKILSITNMPDHEHNMQGSQDTQYYAYRASTGTPTDEGAFSATGGTSVGEGQFLPSSGAVSTNLPLQQPFNVINPFLALNYIIFTGKDVL
jgi:microcystin-dependent protein